MTPKDFTRCLPFELVLLIIGHLDHYSVLALLEAVPWLKRNTVLITDHHFPPIFTTTHGLKRRYLPSKCPHHHDFPLYDKTLDREPIRVVEFAYVGFFDFLGRIVLTLPHGITKTDQILDLNSTSFVFTKNDGNDTETRLPEAVKVSDMVRNGSKWLTECKVLPSEDSLDKNDLTDSSMAQSVMCPKLLTGVPCSMNVTSSTAGLQFLYVDNTAVFKGHTFPVLKSLTVIFAKSQYSELSDITAPEMSALVVHYNNIPPVIKTITAKPEKYVTDHTFVLMDIARYSCNCPTPDHYQVEKIASMCGFEFMRYFSLVHLSGVPFEIFEVMEFFQTSSLNYRISVSDTRTNKKEVLIPLLDFMWLTVVTEDLNLPVIICPKLSVIHLTLLSKNTKIAGVMMGITGDRLSYVDIYRSPSLVRSDNTTVMSAEEWQEWFKRHSLSLSGVMLSGFSMPFIYLIDDIDQRPLELPKCCFMNLRPTLDSKAMADVIYKGNDLHIDGFRFGERLRDFNFEPSFGDPEVKRWCSGANLILNIDVSIIHYLFIEDFVLTCSPKFASYALGNLALSTDLSQRWRGLMIETYGSPLIGDPLLDMKIMQHAWKVFFPREKYTEFDEKGNIYLHYLPTVKSSCVPSGQINHWVDELRYLYAV